MRQANASGRQYQFSIRTSFTEIQIRKFADHRDPDNLMNLIHGRYHSTSNAPNAQYPIETPKKKIARSATSGDK
jgi:hypothetical protein